MWPIEPNEPASNSPALVEDGRHLSPGSTAAATLSQSCIGNGWSVKGEIAGTESLFIGGCLEGAINLPNGLLTLGPQSRVRAEVTVRDMVVRGQIEGQIVVTNRLDIRSGAVVTGNIAASRLSIEDGACIQGKVNTAEELAVLARPGGAAAEGAKITRLRPRAMPIPA